MHLANSVRHAGRALLRRDRHVIATYRGLGLGNLLYLALQAAIHREAGAAWYVLDSDHEAPWHQSFEQLSSLFLAVDEMQFLDHSVYLPKYFFQRFDEDFSRAQLNSFISAYVLPSRPPEGDSEWLTDTRRLCVNVRRGDYYSAPDFREAFGFDVAAYVAFAVEHVLRSGFKPDVINVVSDDVAWCQQELPFLHDSARTVTFIGPDQGLRESFFAVATANAAIVSNSTFSYWAAYTNAVISAHPLIVAPDLFMWQLNGGRPWQADPRWTLLPVAPLPVVERT